MCLPADQPAKRLVEYKGSPEPSSLHPLWKQWLNHARETAPTPRDVYAWEVDQARLQKRLKEIDEASTKMRAEDLAQRERGDVDMGSAISRITSQIMNDTESTNTATRAPSRPQEPEWVVPPQSDLPAPGTNMTFENGVPVVPKDHQPYTPDPSRLQQLLNKKKFEQEQTRANTNPNPTTPSKSTWDMNASKRDNTDDL